MHGEPQGSPFLHGTQIRCEENDVTMPVLHANTLLDYLTGVPQRKHPEPHSKSIFASSSTSMATGQEAREPTCCGRPRRASRKGRRCQRDWMTTLRKQLLKPLSLLSPRTSRSRFRSASCSTVSVLPPAAPPAARQSLALRFPRSAHCRHCSGCKHRCSKQHTFVIWCSLRRLQRRPY